MWNEIVDIMDFNNTSVDREKDEKEEKEEGKEEGKDKNTNS